MQSKLPAFLRVFWRSAIDWYDSWLDWLLIGVVWLLAQMTVILGPAASFGVYYVANVMVREGQSLGLKGAFAGAKKYFGVALLWGVINWAVVLLTAVNIFFYGNMENMFGLVARYLIIGIAILWMVVQFYHVPFFMALEEEKIFPALRNAFFITLASFPFTLGLMIFVILVIGLSSVLVIPAFLGLPMLIPVMDTLALYDRQEVFVLRKKDVEPRDVP
ncbi:MAG: hypothetical protein HY835_14970 [Anaerolineae bacterium]|nr:hypothetical protein [Anaerolineae bacterium]